MASSDTPHCSIAVVFFSFSSPYFYLHPPHFSNLTLARLCVTNIWSRALGIVVAKYVMTFFAPLAIRKKGWGYALLITYYLTLTVMSE